MNGAGRRILVNPRNQVSFQGYDARALSATVVVIGGLVRQVQVGVVERQVLVRLATCLCFKVDSQVSVHQGGMVRNVFDIAAGHGVDGVDEMLRLMQPLALGLIALQRLCGDPIQTLEADGGCSLGR